MIIMGMISIGLTGKIMFTTMINMMMIASIIPRKPE
jgi:cell division protein FtsW (lipid II flippase)